MLKLDLQSKSFGDQEILGGIKIELSVNDRLAIIGASGAGKTTLLRIIAGLDHKYTGTCNAPDKIALMFQSPNLLPWRTARENLTIFHPNTEAGKIDEMLDRVGLANKSAHFPNQLSLGQQRRLSLARSCLGAYELILLDEPFASLDENTRDEMIRLVDEFADKTPLILVTHSKAEAHDLRCDILKI